MPIAQSETDILPMIRDTALVSRHVQLNLFCGRGQGHQKLDLELTKTVRPLLRNSQ
jgi:hypothetical protein